MAIRFAFGIDDFNQIGREDLYNDTTFQDLISLSKSSLKELEISDALVSLIRKVDGSFCCGSSRIPLLIRTDHEQFILKSYDSYKIGREQAMLLDVQGLLAPQVFFLGSSFYTEEYIDHATFPTLEALADKGEEGLASAAWYGGIMHASLARLGIRYAHNHWLDEFHYGNGRQIITDFGTSHYFGEDIYSYEKKVAYVQEGNDDFLEEFGIIPCFDVSSPAYWATRDRIIHLSDDPATLIDLAYVMHDGVTGLKEYSECIHARTLKGYANYPLSEEWVSPWDRAREVFPIFVESFEAEYKRQ